MKTKALVVVMLGVLASNAQAYDEPAVNLGRASFLDGAPAPGGTGWIFSEYLVDYSANKMMNNAGNQLRAPPKQSYDVVSPVTQLVYLPPSGKFGNKQLGFLLALPWATRSDVDDGLHNKVLKGATGAGDLTAGVGLQFDPVMGAHGAVFAQRFGLQLTAPTGDYDRSAALSPSSNFWSIAPYWAATVWATPRLSFSARLNYLWNGKNTAPNTTFAPGASSSQAGQALFGNFSGEYALGSTWSVGLSGYWLQQITDAKVNGADDPATRERVWALGPEVMMRLSSTDVLSLSYYQEFAVENRTEGEKMMLRYSHHF